MNIMDYLIPVGAVLGISAACAMMYEKSFSINVFLTALTIGIAVLCWIPLIPSYSIVISVLIIVGMFFKDSGDSTIAEGGI